ncbi:cation:proton antiporter [Caenimonas aquaedulcis]|uniref:Sodium:proton antiporter n=1 Tax=Caenimonas aquaedulcis TaxID=2793270 RepID=A0A931H8B7_9BURK|nr:sodium:proton antiporter [Caenimonas aquaedulcis]MBG9390388.1 sodium:proton antiporter [Caenimonas aquaedulcis]
MEFATWSIVVGVLLILMALSGTVLSRLPLSTSMLYLGAGLAVSPLGLGLMSPTPHQHTLLLERLTEVVVLVSLFTAGLKLSPGLRDKRWLLPLRLAVTSMVVTVALVATAAWVGLGWPIGACILLGAILAPTDPVLASDVQVHQHNDRDRLRFSLTGEGGLNDGTAFPFVLLGLGLMGLHDLGSYGWRWLLVDTLWAASMGPVVGGLLGWAIGKLVLYLRREHKEAVGLDDFLAMGLVALSYGLAQFVHANGFLAVFAAGVALRYLEQSQTPRTSVSEAAAQAHADPDKSVADAVAVDPEHAPAYMAQAVLGFNEQIERIGEVAVVITIGALLWAVPWHSGAWWLVPLLFLLIRPAAVAIGLLQSPSTKSQRWLIGWFGIRGVGSIYYLMYAVNHGLPTQFVDPLVALTLAVVVTSIIVHGISVTPLMAAYERTMRRGRGRKR